ncbi:MAG TPA: site-specific integrase [Planctomycetota bacterium]|nr:site-specific integrase [Planctomycetota bacterium]
MPSQLTLKGAAPQYLEHLRTAGKNAHTVRTYGKALEAIAGFFGEAKALKTLRPADVGRFLKSDALLKKPNGRERAKPTIDQIVRVLRMLLEWAQAQGHVAAVAFPQDAMPKRRRKQQAANQQTQEPEAATDEAQPGN